MDFSLVKTQGTNLRPIDQPRSLKQVAYEALHRAIMAGELLQGQIYREKELAAKLSISRTPVREALLELSAKELVEYLPRKGVMIKQFDNNDWEEIFELRRALEVAIIEKVATRASPEDVQRMEAILREQQACTERNDFLEFLHHDRLFHSFLSEKTDNSRMSRSYSNIQDLIQLMGTYALTAKGRTKEALEEHQGIVAAIAAGDADSAKKAMLNHLEITKKLALERYTCFRREHEG
jgi:DNA-binding GntR family transcriptional regulator